MTSHRLGPAISEEMYSNILYVIHIRTRCHATGWPPSWVHPYQKAFLEVDDNCMMYNSIHYSIHFRRGMRHRL